ncbi:MAG: hypothetical protein AAF600_06095 [Bacteroidota bacterium]
MKHSAGHAFMRHCTKITSLLFGIYLSGQDIAIGTWRTHFSYQNAQQLTSTDDKIFCAVENGLFSYSLTTGETRKLSKVDGLSAARISAMAYDEENHVLIIGYGEGLVDFIFKNEIITISDIANSDLEGGKKINEIAVNDEVAYLATNLGVIVITISTTQITENYIQIGSGGNEVEVNEIIAKNDSLFILTNEGVQSGSLDNNLLDFNNWIRYPNTTDFRDFSIENQKLYSVRNDGSIMVFSNGTWRDSETDLPEGASRLFELNLGLYTAANGEIFKWANGAFERTLTSNALLINDLIAIGGELFIADGNWGLVNENGVCLSPSGPLSDGFSRIKIFSDTVYAFHAPSVLSYDGTQKMVGYSYFSADRWANASIAEFENISDVEDFDGVRYFSSIGNGLYIQNTNEIVTDIPGSTSSLDTILTTLSSGDRLWVGGSGSQPIHVRDEEGNWVSYHAFEVFNTGFLSIDIAETEVAWAVSQNGNITIIDTQENAVDELSISDGLPSSVNDITISIEDNVWVATNRGSAFYPTASFVFSNKEAILPTFENRVLFEDEVVNAALTDGGNRIWFGTNRGLWVFDENTSEQVAFFNASSSPLPSDQILDLAYNGENGEVFIVTEKGMVSYRSASSIGSNTHSNVSVFPNPVRPGYAGLVGISGLARNAHLKITDINGNLVKEIVASGSSASWDLLDQEGRRVTTGIYYFFSASSDGEETFVGKIAVVR